MPATTPSVSGVSVSPEPVAEGTEFADLRRVTARRRNCVEEVRLNRRLSHDVYLGTRPLLADAGVVALATCILIPFTKSAEAEPANTATAQASTVHFRVCSSRLIGSGRGRRGMGVAFVVQAVLGGLAALWMRCQSFRVCARRLRALVWPVRKALVSRCCRASGGGGQIFREELRTRLQELQTKLGVRAPVYVLVTKADLLAAEGVVAEDVERRAAQDFQLGVSVGQTIS